MILISYLNYIKKHTYPNKMLISIPAITSLGKCTPLMILLEPMRNAIINVKNPKYDILNKNKPLQ